MDQNHISLLSRLYRLRSYPTASKFTALPAHRLSVLQLMEYHIAINTTKIKKIYICYEDQSLDLCCYPYLTFHTILLRTM